MYRFVVKSLRTRTKDATGRFDANGEGRAVERSSGSVARGIKGRVAESTTSVSTRALCSGDDGSKTIEILEVSWYVRFSVESDSTGRFLNSCA